MLRKEMNKAEIEREFAGKGDYVLIDNITRFLKENLSQDIRRICFVKLVEIYERRNMFFEAANLYDKLAEIAMNSFDRINYLLKEADCYIKSGIFEKADATVTKLAEYAKSAEKNRIMIYISQAYKRQAEVYEREKRRNKAAKTYEKLLTMNIPEDEKKEVNQRLSVLYKELGMIDEYMKLNPKI
jgi:tetratricopeptide (TPR) repeat protein